MGEEKVYYCNKCEKPKCFAFMNSLEREEYFEQGSFVCSDCINDEMNSKPDAKNKIKTNKDWQLERALEGIEKID